MAKNTLIDFMGESEAGTELVFGLIPGDGGQGSLPVPGIRWSQKTGYQSVLAPPGMRFEPYAITGDAQTLYGFNLIATDVKTAFGRLLPNGRFVPYVTPWATLRPGDNYPSDVAVNPDGTAIVPPEYYMPIKIFGSPVRSFTVNLPTNCSSWSARPIDNKGDVFVSCTLFDVTAMAAPKRTGFRVTPDGEAQAVPQWLSGAGLSVVGWNDMWVLRVSDDGKTVFGRADYQGKSVFFAAHVP